MAASGVVSIVPLTPDRLEDLAAVFDQPGDPKWCWCASFRITQNVKSRPPAENRAVLEAASERRPPGLIAYRAADSAPVGWVSLGPRADYVKLAKLKVFAPVDDRPVWSIVCFVVARAERGQGVARELLAAAIEYARAEGAMTLEAYPADARGKRLHIADAYKGTLSMFERAGFAVVARRRWSATTVERLTVRLEL